MTPLERVIQHVRAQGRAGTHQALLLAEIDRLRALLEDRAEVLVERVKPPASD